MPEVKPPDVARRVKARSKSGREKRECEHDGIHEHGTNTAYVLDGCRCDPCTDAMSLYAQQRGKDLYLNGPTLIDVVPSQRRIQSLLRIGWTKRELEKRLGMTDKGLSTVMKQPLIRRDTAQRITQLYNELWNVWPAGWAADMNRRRAKADGFLLPAEWEEWELDATIEELAIEHLKKHGYDVPRKICKECGKAPKVFHQSHYCKACWLQQKGA